MRSVSVAASGEAVRLGTVGTRWRGNRRVPEVRLAGKWLGDAACGFGKECEIRVEPGRLTIQAA